MRAYESFVTKNIGVVWMKQNTFAEVFIETLRKMKERNSKKKPSKETVKKDENSLEKMVEQKKLQNKVLEKMIHSISNKATN